MTHLELVCTPLLVPEPSTKEDILGATMSQYGTTWSYTVWTLTWLLQSEQLVAYLMAMDANCIPLLNHLLWFQIISSGERETENAVWICSLYGETRSHWGKKLPTLSIPCALIFQRGQLSEAAGGSRSYHLWQNIIVKLWHLINGCLSLYWYRYMIHC